MGARILVADDSVTIQKVVELTLSREEFVLVQARSGAEALERAKESRPDLVLLDILMPDKNGYEVCAALRAEPSLRQVPVILLTGTFEAFDAERAAAVGATDHITKPFESQQLIGKVKRLLFARGLEPAGAERPHPAPPSGVELSLADIEPPAAPRPSELSTPSLEISQDQLWQLLEGASPAPAPPVELSLESLEAPPPPDLSPADAPGMELSLASEEPAPSPEPAGAAPLSDLSLDDLLGGAAAPPAEEPAAAVPVFDLAAAMETPPLPMVEAGTGEPPSLSMEELLGTVAPAPPAAAEVSGFDLPGPEPVDFEAVLEESPAEPAAEPEALELGLDLDLSTPTAAVTPGALGLEEVPEISEPAGVAELGLEEAAPPAAAEVSGFDLPGPEPAAPSMAPAEAGLAAAPAAAVESPPVAPPGLDIAALRDAVTERVAGDLARELSGTLIARIEKVVWEVVPDLAEVLITREIERIRRMAEEQKSA